MIDHTIADLKYAVRQIGRAPLLTTVAAISVALGIAVAVTAFTLLNAALLKPLPVPDAEGVYHVYTSDYNGRHQPWGTSSYADYQDFARSGAFQSLAAFFDHGEVVATLPGQAPRDEIVSFTSSNYLSSMDVRLVIGRPPVREDAPEIVLTHRYWQRAFNKQQSAVGSQLKLNGVLVTVVGVAPEKFRGLGFGAPLIGWVPAGVLPEITGQANPLTQRGSRSFKLVGRLAAGQSTETAETQLRTVARALAEQDPDAWLDENKEVRLVSVLTHRQSLLPPGTATRIWLGVAAAAVLVLFIIVLACTNVAGLLLARAINRQHEVAVRLSLGASRWRLLRQLLTESVLLASIAGVLAWLLTLWVMRFVTLRFAELDAFDLRTDWRVLAATSAFSLFSAIAFGLAPALQSLRVDIKSTFLSSTTAGDRSGMRGALIALQVAISCVLILLAFSASRAVQQYLRVDPGYNAQNMLIIRPELIGLRGDTIRQAVYMQDLRERLLATPGVQGVTSGSVIPLPGNTRGYEVELAGEKRYSSGNGVGADYFRTMQIPVLQGRDFTEADARRGSKLVAVNRTLAERYGGDVLGKIVTLYEGMDAQIIAVVRDVVPAGQPPGRAYLYELTPFTNNTSSTGQHFLVRVAPGAEESVMVQMQRYLRDRYPDLVIPAMHSLQEFQSWTTIPHRIASRAALSVGIVELALASIGLYGLLLFTLLARSREVGVRLALGARPRDAAWSVMRSGLRFAAIGAVVGLMLGVPVSIGAAKAFPGVSAADPVPFLAAFAAVSSAAAIAAYLPVRRAARIQPMAALRSE